MADVTYSISIDSSGAVQGVEEVDASVEQLDDSTQSTESSFDSVTAGAVALGTIAVQAFNVISSAVSQTIQESVNLARRQEEAEARVASLVETTGMAAGFTAEELTNMASEMQGLTRFGDEAILESQAKLLTFRSVAEDNFERTLAAAMDLAEAGFGSLEQNITQMGRALEDPTQGLTALRESGVSFTEAQKEQIEALVESNQLYEAQAMILEAVEGQVQGTAEALAQTDSGRVEQLTNSIGDLQEALGFIILEGMQPYTEALHGIVNMANEYLSVPLSDELQKEQIRVNTLVSAIQNQNTSADRRNELLRELEQLQPTLAENLRNENSSTQDIADSLELVNERYQERIILQSQQEEIESEARNISAALNDQMRAQMTLTEELTSAAQEYGLNLADFVNKPIEEQVDIIGRQINAQNRSRSEAGRNLEAFNQLQQMLHEYRDSMEQVTEAENQAAETRERHRQIVEMLGLETERTGDTQAEDAQRQQEYYDGLLTIGEDYIEIYSEQKGQETQVSRISQEEITNATLSNILNRKLARNDETKNAKANAEAQKKAALESQRQIAVATINTMNQQIQYAESVAEGVRAVIRALLAETVAYAIRGAFASSLNPIVGGVLAASGAAIVNRLFDSAVPEFAEGGMIDDDDIRRQRPGNVQASGGATSDSATVKLSNGEYVMNAASTRMMRPILEEANGSPTRAREILQSIRESRKVSTMVDTFSRESRNTSNESRSVSDSSDVRIRRAGRNQEELSEMIRRRKEVQERNLIQRYNEQLISERQRDERLDVSTMVDTFSRETGNTSNGNRSRNITIADMIARRSGDLSLPGDRPMSRDTSPLSMIESRSVLNTRDITPPSRFQDNAPQERMEVQITGEIEGENIRLSQDTTRQQRARTTVPIL